MTRSTYIMFGIAGLAYRLGNSFPSCLDGFDSRIPLSNSHSISEQKKKAWQITAMPSIEIKHLPN